MTVQKEISQNIKYGKLISLYNNVPFIFECFHEQQDSQWHEKASQRYQTKNSQNGPNFFILLSSGNRTPGSRFYSDLWIPLFASTSSYSSVVQSARLLVYV